ncbi:transposase [Xanthocytophaga flava]|uniref:transposase n=1 Tax=Xanthocytophaga flava TaxID=3048013 RepID=UPI0028D00AD1|nr:transposase [Xanthocytophaga flavus]MDJ1473149.1 hypothetical protein [Xanthocytophaga flavus]
MVLNEAGNMIKKWYEKIDDKFPDVELGEYIIMPNHVHFILIRTDTVGANPCVRPVSPPKDLDNEITSNDSDKPNQTGHNQGEHMGSPLQKIIQWFKTMTTNEYIRGVKENKWPAFPGKLWQRNYHEHIIRNQPAYEKITDYILSNPQKWEQDSLYQQSHLDNSYTL